MIFNFCNLETLVKKSVYLTIKQTTVLHSFLMKYFFLLFASLMSCTSMSTDPENSKSNDVIVNQESDFKHVLSKGGTYTLHYKMEEEKNSPVKRFTYYVTTTADKKVARKSETVAAEKIYWKNNYTLAIIPYVEVMRASTEVGVNPQQQEILITIK